MSLELTYLKFKGEIPPSLSKELSSLLPVASKKTEFASEALMKHSLDDLESSLKTVLYSYGYFDCHLERKISLTTSSSFEVEFSIELNTPYTVSSYSFLHLPAQIEDLSQTSLSPLSFGLTSHSELDPYKIEDTRKHLTRFLKEHGYPYAQVNQSKIEVFSQTKTCHVSFDIQAGSLHYFGKHAFEGEFHLKEEFLNSQIAWKEGELFNSQKVELTTKNFEKLGIFELVQVNYPPLNCDDPSLPMNIVLLQEKSRTIASGFNYNTHLGLGLDLEWEHRNLNEQAIHFSSQLSLFDKEKTLDLFLKDPGFAIHQQELKSKLRFQSTDQEGFNDQEIQLTSWIEQQPKRGPFFSYGSSISYSKTTESDNNNEFLLIGFPLTTKVKQGTNPRFLITSEYTFTPTINSLDTSIHYIKQEGSLKIPLLRFEKGASSNFNVKVGSIAFNEREELPPSQRFYGGGPNFFRGYEYKTLSPLDSSQKPLGGRSYWLTSQEVLIPLSKILDFEIFFETGQVQANSLPAFYGKTFSSTGGGVEVVTPIGPLKTEVAFPLNPRSGIDSPVQFYLSLEKAF